MRGYKKNILRTLVVGMAIILCCKVAVWGIRNWYSIKFNAWLKIENTKKNIRSAVDLKYTGFKEYKGKKYYIKDGKYQKNFTGIMNVYKGTKSDRKEEYCIIDGKFQPDYTGIFVEGDNSYGVKVNPEKGQRRCYVVDGMLSKKRTKVMQKALNVVGNPYKYGGMSLTEGVDCSGFIYLIYEGIIDDWKRYRTAVRYYDVAEPISREDLEPGDVVFFIYNDRNFDNFSYYDPLIRHMAIYIGNGKIVHAKNRSEGICIDNVDFSEYECRYGRIIQE